jgi:3-oxoacyl-[acyl-carrier protein] reductase
VTAPLAASSIRARLWRREGPMAIETGLKGKVVVVTGGGAGIGRATAERFKAEGAIVYSWDVTGDPKIDVTNKEQVENAVAGIIATHGHIDVLVNNAGIVRDAQLVKWKDGKVAGTMDDAAFDAVINVNLKGPFVCTRAVVPHMIEAGRGVILTTSSVVGLYGNFGQTNYAATKAGVISFTKTWARELGRYGIRVNAIAPGFIATDIVKSMPPKVLESMAQKTPLGRMGEPADIANGFVWLASDAAKFVSGAVLSIDGGLVLGT